jgi:hypothetical protein
VSAICTLDFGHVPEGRNAVELEGSSGEHPR